MQYKNYFIKKYTKLSKALIHFNLCHTEPKAKYLNLYFIKKYIHIFFKSNSAEASSFLKALLNKFFSINHEAENYPFHILNL